MLFVDLLSCYIFILFLSNNVLQYHIYTDATAYISAHFGPDATIIIALDDVACTPYESRLIDCPHDRNIADCSHSEDAGVQCVPRESYQYIE